MASVPADLKPALEYIEAHLRDDLSIAELARQASYSPWHFYHLFTDAMGMPVMAYVRMRRLMCAVEEMKQGSRLSDIAVDFGFSTPAGFYKAFQRQFGCSPSRYRRHQQRAIRQQVDPILIAVARKGDNMHDRVIIRPLVENDAESLWENIFSRNTLREVRDRVSDNLRDEAKGVVRPLVAEVDGHAVGFMRVSFETHPLSAHRCTLGDVVVNPAFWRMGIARRLLEAGKKDALAKGKAIMTVAARGGTTAEMVYVKLGFTEYGRLPSGIVEAPPYWEETKGFDEVLLYLALNEVG